MSNFSAQQAADPTTPASVLAQIAYERPDLRAAVAANPSAYPELLDWLTSFNDPQVNAAVAARSAQPQAPQQAPQPPQQAPQPPQQQTPMGYGAQGAQGEQQGFAPRGRGPEDAYAQQVQAFEQNQHGASGAQAAHQGYGQHQSQQGGGYPMYGGPAQHGTAEPKRKRKGLLIGGIVAAVAVLGVGGWAVANQLLFSKIKPAASPEEAVTKIVEGIADKDALSIYGSLSPAEFDSIKKYMDSSSDLVEGTDLEQWQDRGIEIIDELEVTLEGLEVRVEPIEDGLAKVFITEGEMTVDADSEELAQLVADLGEEVTSSEVFSDLGMGMTEYNKDEVFADTKQELDAELPASLKASEMASADGTDAFLMAVEEDGDWYVSPYLTIAEYVYDELGGTERGSLPDADAVNKFDTPEAAAEGLTDAIVDFATTGSTTELVNSLPLAERRLLALYGSDMPAELAVAPDAFSIPSKEFNVRSEEDGWAHLTFKDFRVLVEDAYSSMELSFRGPCVGFAESVDSIEVCVDEVPLLREFALQDMSILAVEEGDGWFISPTATVTDAWSVVGKSMLDLYLDGKFEDEAWLDQQGREFETYLEQHPELIELFGSTQEFQNEFNGSTDPYGGFDEDFGDFEGEDWNFDEESGFEF